jgi:hypothetical protein
MMPDPKDVQANLPNMTHLLCLSAEKGSHLTLTDTEIEELQKVPSNYRALAELDKLVVTGPFSMPRLKEIARWVNVRWRRPRR